MSNKQVSLDELMKIAGNGRTLMKYISDKKINVFNYEDELLLAVLAVKDKEDNEEKWIEKNAGEIAKILRRVSRTSNIDFTLTLRNAIALRVIDIVVNKEDKSPKYKLAFYYAVKQLIGEGSFHMRKEFVEEDLLTALVDNEKKEYKGRFKNYDPSYGGVLLINKIIPQLFLKTPKSDEFFEEYLKKFDLDDEAWYVRALNAINQDPSFGILQSYINCKAQEVLKDFGKINVGKVGANRDFKAYLRSRWFHFYSRVNKFLSSNEDKERIKNKFLALAKYEFLSHLYFKIKSEVEFLESIQEVD